MTLTHRLLQAILKLSFWAASASLAGIFLLTAYEVFVRYALNQPTTWSTDSSTYLMCAAVFLTLPRVTSEGANVAVNILTDRFRGTTKLASILFVELVTAAACALAFAMCLHVLGGQFSTSAKTVDGIAFPRWILTSLLAFGFGMSFVCHVARAVGFRTLHDDATSRAQL